MAEQQDNQGAPDNPEPSPDQGQQSQPGKTETKPGKLAPREPRATLSREQRAALADKVIGKQGDDTSPKDPPKPKVEAKPVPKAEAKPEPKEPAAEPEKTEPTEGAIDDKARTELADLLKAGQLEELAEKLGVDRKAVDVSNAKLRLARGRNQEAEGKLRKADETLATAKQLQDAAKKEYGAPHKAREAYDKGDFAEAAQWIAKALDDDFATITRNVANATKGMDAKELARFQKDRELNQREAALAAKERAGEQRVTDEQRTAKAVKTIEAKCAGHDVLKIRGGNKLVLRRLEEAFDPKSGELKLGYKQAADQVLGEFLEDAKALGLTRGEPSPKAEPPKEEPRGKREFPAVKKEDDGSEKTRGLSFAERQARAARAYERTRV